MKTLVFVSIPLFFLFSAGFCQSAKPMSETLPWQDYDHLEVSELEKLTEEARSNSKNRVATTLELTQLVALAKSYEAYREQYYNSSLAAEYLYRAGQIYENFLGESRKALFLYGDLHDNYRDHKRHPEAVFNIALLYENRYKDVANAMIWYDYFLLLYPDHSLASMVTMNRNMLGNANAKENIYNKTIDLEADNTSRQ